MSQVVLSMDKFLKTSLHHFVSRVKVISCVFAVFARSPHYVMLICREALRALESTIVFDITFCI